MLEPFTAPIKHRIKTFVRREGRMTPGQLLAITRYWDEYGVELGDTPLDLSLLFNKSAPIILEIGFGMGQSLAKQAQAMPEQNYIGIEVHRPGVGALLNSLAALGLSNVKVFNDDAWRVLTEALPNQSLAGIQVFFPDPWPKLRHHKRRIIQPEWVALMLEKLQPGGFLHLATDIENYAEQMLAVLSANPHLQNSHPTTGYAPRPAHRPITKFENRALTAGRKISDLIFTKVSG